MTEHLKCGLSKLRYADKDFGQGGIARTKLILPETMKKQYNLYGITGFTISPQWISGNEGQ